MPPVRGIFRHFRAPVVERVPSRFTLWSAVRHRQSARRPRSFSSFGPRRGLLAIYSPFRFRKRLLSAASNRFLFRPTRGRAPVSVKHHRFFGLVYNGKPLCTAEPSNVCKRVVWTNFVAPRRTIITRPLPPNPLPHTYPGRRVFRSLGVFIFRHVG